MSTRTRSEVWMDESGRQIRPIATAIPQLTSPSLTTVETGGLPAINLAKFLGLIPSVLQPLALPTTYLVLSEHGSSVMHRGQ